MQAIGRQAVRRPCRLPDSQLVPFLVAPRAPAAYTSIYMRRNRYPRRPRGPAASHRPPTPDYQLPNGFPARPFLVSPTAPATYTSIYTHRNRPAGRVPRRPPAPIRNRTGSGHPETLRSGRDSFENAKKLRLTRQGRKLSGLAGLRPSGSCEFTDPGRSGTTWRQELAPGPLWRSTGPGSSPTAPCRPIRDPRRRRDRQLAERNTHVAHCRSNNLKLAKGR